MLRHRYAGKYYVDRLREDLPRWVERGWIRAEDAESVPADAAARPSAYGLSNVADACLTGATNFAGGTPCANPGAYLFWDDIHPSATAHAALGRQALALVTEASGGAAAVPEPGSLALLGVGVAALTWTRRRRAA